jgi:O-antigen/teichoic acid export membrane protein
MAKNEVRLTYAGLILFLSRLLSVGTGLIFSLMVTRNTIDPRRELGIYSNLSDTLTYFTLPAMIIPFWTTRFTARNHAGAPRTGLTANLILSAIFTAIYALLLPTITSAFQIGEAYVILYIIVVIQILELYTLRVFEAILHARQPQKIGYGFLIFEACKVIIGYILIIQRGVRGPEALLAAVTSVIIAYTLQLVFYLRLTAHGLQGKIRWSYLKEWLKASPINLYNIGGQRLAALVLILLFIYAGEARGDYRAGQIVATIIGHSSVLAFALYPKLLSKTDSKDISTSLRMVLMFAIPMTVGAIILSDSYVTIMNPEYGPARPVLIILAMNMLCMSVSSVFSTIVSGTEKVDEKAKIPFRKLIKTKLFLIYTLPYIKAAISLPLTYFILTTMAQTATGAATFVATIIFVIDIPTLFATYSIARKCIDFSMPWKNIAKYVAASAVMVAVLFAIPHPTRIIYTLAVTLLGGAVYILILLPTDREARSLARSIIQEMLRITRLSR